MWGLYREMIDKDLKSALIVFGIPIIVLSKFLRSNLPQSKFIKSTPSLGMIV